MPTLISQVPTPAAPTRTGAMAALQIAIDERQSRALEVPKAPRTTRQRILKSIMTWSGQRRLSLRQLREELLEAAATTPDGVVARVQMLNRLDADIAVAEQAWHPNAGPDVTWPIEILKARYRGIGELLRSR